MTEAVSNILSAISLLSPAEREQVISAVLGSHGTSPIEAGGQFDATLARRIAEARSGAVSGTPAEEVFARLRARRQ